ncbi:MAG: di-trans,poly-cis-decaprenylcistransferase [Deltaproteobacteria bacterium]|nr:di-trans,poly-cis-decaprenylcistransferase [Deltaproteobacteria bacterium]
MQNPLTHVAIIMDGNGRWAQKNGLIRLKGHEKGARVAKDITKAVKARGIRFLTLYAFSSENWRRPKDEVEGLFRLLERFIETEIQELKDNGVRLRVIGDLSRFTLRLKDKIYYCITETSENQDLILSIALNYGGRDEIVRAVREMMGESIPPEKINEETFGRFLDTRDIPDPDLLIRTGGEKRISNFLLWQVAYAEIYFTDVLWPEFDEHELDKAINWFSGRQRRFGMTSEQVTR